MSEVYVALTDRGFIISASSTPEKAKQSIKKYYGRFCTYKYKDVRDSGIEFIAYVKSWFRKTAITVHELTLDEL